MNLKKIKIVVYLLLLSIVFFLLAITINSLTIFQRVKPNIITSLELITGKYLDGKSFSANRNMLASTEIDISTQLVVSYVPATRIANNFIYSVAPNDIKIYSNSANAPAREVSIRDFTAEWPFYEAFDIIDDSIRQEINLKKSVVSCENGKHTCVELLIPNIYLDEKYEIDLIVKLLNLKELPTYIIESIIANKSTYSIYIRFDTEEDRISYAKISRDNELIFDYTTNESSTELKSKIYLKNIYDEYIFNEN